MALEQLLQVYSMTAYSWPSSSISFCKGTRDRQGKNVRLLTQRKCQKVLSSLSLGCTAKLLAMLWAGNHSYRQHP